MKKAVKKIDVDDKQIVAPDQTTNETVAPITKPKKFSLDRFKTKRLATIANVETLLVGLPLSKLGDVKDWVRLHPNEAEYWTEELCFVNVPIKGQKKDTLHLIDEDLAMQYLSGAKILRFRLALATKPNDVFFLCHVPTRNLDNSYNKTCVAACEQAKMKWLQLTSLKEQGIEDYKREFARDQDAFPEPKWPSQSLDELVQTTLAGRMIEDEDHPALLRLIGAKQSLS
jgi:hypothetical protein